MQYGYLIMRVDIEDSDEAQWGYPQYIHEYPVAIYDHKSTADMRILEMYQEDADEFMDWLDVEKEYCNEIGAIFDIGWCTLERHDYECYKVPYYKSAQLEDMVFKKRDAKNVIKLEDEDNIIRNKPIKIVK